MQLCYEIPDSRRLNSWVYLPNFWIKKKNKRGATRPSYIWEWKIGIERVRMEKLRSCQWWLTQVLIRLVFPFHLSILRISKEATPLLACTSLYRDWLSKGVEGTLMFIGYFRDIVVYAWGTFCAFGKIVFTSLCQPILQSLRFEWKLPEASLFPSLGWNGSWSLFAWGGLYDQSRRALF